MESGTHPVRYRVYWLVWGVLLAITLFMIAIGLASIPRSPKVALLVMAMLAKGSLIAAFFMHLRSERRGLVCLVAAGILLTAAVLYTMVSLDGMRILELSLR